MKQIKQYLIILVGGFLCFYPAVVSGDNYSRSSAKDVPLDIPLTIEQSLELAGENMLNMLNPERNYLPYFRTTVRLGNYDSNMAFWWPAHNIGRWWDAVLQLEDTFGFQIPGHIESAMLENVKLFFDNPDCIPLNPRKDYYAMDVIGKKLQWDIHSLREGMLALYSLVKWRNNEWAVETGRQMISSVNDKLLENGEWDLTKFDAYHKRGPFVIHNMDPCDTHGRFLEALIWFYEETGDQSAKELADRIAVWHFNNTTQEDGNINSGSRADHTHSYLGTLRGLLLYGRLTNQPEYIQRVADAYRVNVPKIMPPSGYTSHNMVVESFGETTSSGDIAQLALWLYDCGYDQFLDDVETIVRARILPSQIRSTPPLTISSCAHSDMYVDLEKRIIGGYGGCTVYPHAGKVSVVDVSAADIHSLIDIYNHITIDREDKIEMLLHLDYSDERISIETKEEGFQRTVTVELKEPASLSIRMSQWVESEQLNMALNGVPQNPAQEDRYINMDQLAQGDLITLTYELPKKITKETALGVEYTLYWKGNTVVGISPNFDFYPLYPNAPEEW